MVIFHLAGGWYFGAQIRSDALQVKPFDTEGITIVAIDGSAITLDGGEDPPDDLNSSDLLGLDYGTGYGQVGEATENPDGTVTRPFTWIAGAEPEPGVEATLHAVAYPRDLRAQALPEWTEVTFTAGFGEFPAWQAAYPGAETWVIMVHGRGSHRDEGLRMLVTLSDVPVSKLLISYRNDEGAPQTGDRLARFGTTEWTDLEGAVGYAIANGAQDVVLVGFSMGGAISLAFLERSDLADRVSAVILDAPALDLGGMVSARAGDTDVIPGIPWKVPWTLTFTAKKFAEIQYGVNWWVLDYLSRSGSIAVPILLLHGDADDTVPVQQSIELADARADLVTLEVFEGAGHVRSWNVDPDRYERVVRRFLSEILGIG